MPEESGFIAVEKAREAARRLHWSERLARLLSSTPLARRVHRSIRVTMLLSLAAIAFLLYQAGMLRIFPPGLEPKDLDLSGSWKIAFNDQIGFSSPALDDSQWCPIQVPHVMRSWTRGMARQAIPATCPQDPYPRRQMSLAPFWLRAHVRIAADQRWQSPSLFLGHVNERAQVYWDGQPLARISAETLPSFIPLDPIETRSGDHVLALRVEGGTERPGIAHSYAKKVSIGELADHREAAEFAVRHELAIPLLELTFQIFGLIFMYILTVGARGSAERYVWVAIYFSAIVTFSLCQSLPRSFWIESVESVSRLWISAALIGYCIGFFELKSSVLFASKRLLLLGTAVVSLPVIFGNTVPSSQSIVLWAPIVLAPIGGMLRRLHGPGTDHGAEKSHHGKPTTLFAMLLLQACFCYVDLNGGEVPWLGDASIARYMLARLAGLVMLYAVMNGGLEQLRALKTVTFFGRFIRSGLKTLLVETAGTNALENRFIRSRRVPVMKIDIVGHTEETYGMPYGARRILQDLFYTHIDRVVGDRVFLDHVEGDGSIYYFEEHERGSGCVAALECALKIRDEAARTFDEAFVQELYAFLRVTPEVQYPMKRFLDTYESKFERSFFARKTRVRISLVYGYIDEGLWGLHEKSHYSAEGDLITVLSRLEKSTREGEILVSEEFYEQLESESPTIAKGFEARWRDVVLRGIGSRRVATLHPAPGTSGLYGERKKAG